MTGLIDILTSVLSLIIPSIMSSDPHHRFRIRVNSDLYWLCATTLIVINIEFLLVLDFNLGGIALILFKLLLLFSIIIFIYVYFKYLMMQIKLNLWNHIKYYSVLARAILNNQKKDLELICYELEGGFKSIIRFAKKPEIKKRNRIFLCFMRINWVRKQYSHYLIKRPPKGAKKILRLIGDRRFCKYMAAYSPSTGLELMEQIISAKTYDLPIGRFAENFVVEVIKNKESFIYYEDDEPYELGDKNFKASFLSFYQNSDLIKTLTEKGVFPVDIDFPLDDQQLMIIKEIPHVIRVKS